MWGLALVPLQTGAESQGKDVLSAGEKKKKLQLFVKEVVNHRPDPEGTNG